MMYLLAIVFPPLAVLLSGKPVQAMLNVILTLCGWLPGVIHSVSMVNSHQAEQRSGRQLRELKHQSETLSRVVIGQEKLIAHGGAARSVSCQFCGTSNDPQRQSCSRCYEDLPRS